MHGGLCAINRCALITVIHYCTDDCQLCIAHCSNQSIASYYYYYYYFFFFFTPGSKDYYYFFLTSRKPIIIIIIIIKERFNVAFSK